MTQQQKRNELSFILRCVALANISSETPPVCMTNNFFFRWTCKEPNKTGCVQQRSHLLSKTAFEFIRVNCINPVQTARHPKLCSNIHQTLLSSVEDENWTCSSGPRFDLYLQPGKRNSHVLENKVVRSLFTPLNSIAVELRSGSSVG